MQWVSLPDIRHGLMNIGRYNTVKVALETHDAGDEMDTFVQANAFSSPFRILRVRFSWL